MNNFNFKAPKLDINRIEELSLFQSKINVKFNNLSLLNLAFIHTSYSHESHQAIDNNERLEFLGDSILGLVTCEYLFSLTDLPDEGDCSKIKAAVVSEDCLSEVALELGISKLLLIGRGEELNGGREKKALLADCMEALIAAIYIDQGLDVVREYTLSWLQGQVKKVLLGKNENKDYKSMLQQYYQKKKNKIPEYILDKKIGSHHAQTFYVKVFLGHNSYGPAEGNNKKSAEQKAAQMALTALGLIK